MAHHGVGTGRPVFWAISIQEVSRSHDCYDERYGWRRDERTKEKALKKGNWFKGELREGWKSKTRTVGRKAFLKEGNRRKSKNTTNSTVIFVQSTKGGLLVGKLREDEDRMAGVTGFRIKFQEAGGSKLIDSFDKDLGKGQHCGRKPCS